MSRLDEVRAARNELYQMGSSASGQRVAAARRKLSDIYMGVTGLESLSDREYAELLCWASLDASIALAILADKDLR